MTKLGHTGQYRLKAAGSRSLIRCLKIQAAAGDRRALFGSSHPVDEPNATPRLSWRA